MTIAGSQLGANATMEGWFRWRAGTAVLRDSTSTGGTGWMPAFVTNGDLAYRLGGQGFDTGEPIGTVRDGQWHHIAATKTGTAGALYVDGELVHSSPTGAGSQLATGPWHVMRNGTNAVFSEGEADEVALYRAHSPSEVKSHFDLETTSPTTRCRRVRARSTTARSAERTRPGACWARATPSQPRRSRPVESPSAAGRSPPAAHPASATTSRPAGAAETGG